MTVCATDAVTQVEARIADKIGSQRFNVWFKNATRFLFTDQYCRVNAPNHFISDWIERHFSDTILEAIEEVTGNQYTLSFAIDPLLAKDLRKKQPDRQLDFVTHNPDRLARQPRQVGQSMATPRLKGQLSSFVVGASNRMAHAAAVAVAEAPGKTYNPLFIHGGCGLGKTHLLQGICNHIREHAPQLTWKYVSGEEFTNDFVFSVRAREEGAFREQYRKLDVLIIDDVHFFANKRGTQEEFLNTFKSIDAAGKQIVLASDAHPKMIGHFSESLVSRFLSGMVVRVDSPDVAVRAEVLRRRASLLQVDIGEAVIMHIAENFRANIRELEGALLKVVAQAQVTGQPITVSLAERAMRDLVRQTAPVVVLSDIETVVAIFFGLTPADLHTSRKSRTIALARGIAMYLARKHTGMSFPEIGRYMGNKNHSTVILACRRIGKILKASEPARWMTPAGQREQDLNVLVEELEEQLGLVPADPELSIAGAA